MSDDLDDVVKWVPSQTPIPALRALISEAERDSDPVHPASPFRPTPAPTRSRVLPRAPSSTSHVASEEEPEAIAFVELLREAFKKLDETSLKKQRLAAREKQHKRSACPLTKTLSTSAIASGGRALVKTASLGPGDTQSPTLFLSRSLSSVPKPSSAPPLLVRARPTPTASSLSSPDDSLTRDVIDLTPTDTECDGSFTSYADTSMCMQVDDDDDDDADSPMDMSFVRPPSQSHVPPPDSQPSVALRQTQRARTGPPQLGMRRTYLQPSQYCLSQSTKGVKTPRFKPPLLTNTARPGNKGGNGTAASSNPPRVATKVSKRAQGNKDPDSSFDVSFDMDIDALEEAMKAYD